VALDFVLGVVIVVDMVFGAVIIVNLVLWAVMVSNWLAINLSHLTMLVYRFTVLS